MQEAMIIDQRLELNPQRDQRRCRTIHNIIVKISVWLQINSQESIRKKLAESERQKAKKKI